MSIPLDRLYHYIESVAQEVYGDILIYRFYPHGSKKFEDLILSKQHQHRNILTYLQLICNDQEPLNFDFYKDDLHTLIPDLILKDQKNLLKHNLRKDPMNIYDRCILLHSEKNSIEERNYSRNGFIPAYYWSHALISLDWFRYAKHVNHQLDPTTKYFLIYNRAWSGTREYRLKFFELLAEEQLTDFTKTSLKFVDNNIHYSNHNFHNEYFRPNIILEKYFDNNTSESHYSADFDLEDYNSTQIEVVLETLFDDCRWHLTEKSLRPIAIGKPFILCATPGSLEYLKSYGFKTFSTIIDEDYDTKTDPIERLKSIIKTMKNIAQWSPAERNKKNKELQKIAQFNKKRFFSKKFFNQVTDELKQNLTAAIQTCCKQNTFDRFETLIAQLNSNKDRVEWCKINKPIDQIEAINYAVETVKNLKNK